MAWAAIEIVHATAKAGIEIIFFFSITFPIRCDLEEKTTDGEESPTGFFNI